MRVFFAAAVIALLAGSAQAQDQIPQYRDPGTTKTQQQIQTERDTERAYKRALGNVPDKASSDPWGTVRSESPPKAAAKTSPAKRSKTDSAGK